MVNPLNAQKLNRNVIIMATAQIEGTIPRAIIPDQYPTKARDARNTAKRLGNELTSKEKSGKSYELATILDTMGVQTLKKAKHGGFLLAVDSKSLEDKTEGFYLVVREQDKIYIKTATKAEVQELMSKDKWHDLLYIDQSAIDAAKDNNRPVVLSCYGKYGRHLYAADWPDYGVKVPLVEAKPEELLRAAV